MDDTLLWIIFGAVVVAVFAALHAPSSCNHKCNQGRGCDCGYDGIDSDGGDGGE